MLSVPRAAAIGLRVRVFFRHHNIICIRRIRLRLNYTTRKHNLTGITVIPNECSANRMKNHHPPPVVGHFAVCAQEKNAHLRFWICWRSFPGTQRVLTFTAHCALPTGHQHARRQRSLLARSPISADFCHFSNGNVCVGDCITDHSSGSFTVQVHEYNMVLLV